MRKTFQFDSRAARKIDDGVVPAGKYKKFDHCCVGKPDAHGRPCRIGYPAVVMQLIDKRQRGAIFVCPAGIRTIAMDERIGLCRGDPRLLAIEGHMDAPFILAPASRRDAVDHQLARRQATPGGDGRARPCPPRRGGQQVQFIDPVHGQTPDSRGSAAVLAIIDTHMYRPTKAMSSTISAGTRLRRSAAVVAEVRLRASTSSSAAVSMRRSRRDSGASAVGCKVACRSASARPAASAKPAT